MRKAVETALHKYGLVAFAVNNPQLAVRLCCRSKDRGNDEGCDGDTGAQVRKHNQGASIETALKDEGSL